MSTTANLEEYKTLREELQVRVRGFIYVFAISLVVLVPFISGIIIYWMESMAVMKADPSLLYAYILLSPLFILIPCAYLLVSLRKDIFRCGTYIQVFLESDSEFRWESALSEFRQTYSEETLEPAFWVYWAFLAICSGLFGYTLYLLSQSFWHLVVALLLTLFLAKAHFDYKRVLTKTSEAFRNRWGEIKEAMDERGTIS